ncbi:MAG TPA: class I SAM-dependent methyltransferase [Bacteroidia bacterium]|nr:class I SAM-dependent methyltransferase [Bacteroidia bacterium]
MEWFEDWFNSPYYHLLYSHRDEEEANRFMQNLLAQLKPDASSRILDLACGKGRHAQFIATKGYDVIGIDLSENSIQEALLKSTSNLQFFEHDMRFPFRINYFDYVFNLFTSFGYFNNQRDEINTIKSVALNLKPSGMVVIDFFNAAKVMQMTAKCSEQKTIDGIAFDWKKSIVDKSVIKEINVNDAGEVHHYKEQVRLLTLADFEHYFAKAGLKLAATFGDYQLSPFDVNTSERLIMIAQKQAK